MKSRTFIFLVSEAQFRKLCRKLMKLDIFLHGALRSPKYSCCVSHRMPSRIRRRNFRAFKRNKMLINFCCHSNFFSMSEIRALKVLEKLNNSQLPFRERMIVNSYRNFSKPQFLASFIASSSSNKHKRGRAIFAIHCKGIYEPLVMDRFCQLIYAKVLLPSSFSEIRE